MSIVVLAKNPPGEVTGPLHQLLEFALWVGLVLCLIWLVASAGALYMAKLNSQPISGPAGRILRSLIGAIMASTSLGTAVTFLATTR